MGVCGTGKSTVGVMLAERLGAAFLEADDFHPPANVEKMRGGTPLTDEDRWPWLDAMAAALDEVARGGRNAVVACSALKRRYRDRLLGGHAVGARIVHLHGDEDLIAARLRARPGHFMPPTLLASQIATLETPEDRILADISVPPGELVDAVMRALGGG